MPQVNEIVKSVLFRLSEVHFKINIHRLYLNIFTKIFENLNSVYCKANRFKKNQKVYLKHALLR